MAATAEEAWIDLLLKRAPELRAAGVLQVGIGGNSAVLAIAGSLGEHEPLKLPDVKTDAADGSADPAEEPTNHWENPASYPTGNVPSLGKVDAEKDLPDIPEFET